MENKGRRKMSSHGEGKIVKSRSGFPGSFRTSPPDDAFAANRWPHMGNCSSDAQPSLAQRLRHLCRARVADWVVIETTCLEAALFAATSLGGFPVGETTSPTKGLGKNRKRSKVPQICRNRFAHACCIYRRSRPPQSTPRFLQTVREMFGNVRN